MVITLRLTFVNAAHLRLDVGQMTGRTQIEVARAQAALGEMPAVAIIDPGHRITIGAEKEVVAVVLVLDARLLDPGLAQLRKTAG